MQKFLIIQTAFIGDVVLATALIEKLHTNFPEAQIDFLLRKGNEGLLQNHPYIHEVLIWDKKQHKTRNLFKLISIIRKNKYDKVINVQRFFSTGLMTALSGAQEKTGFDKNPLSFLFDNKVKHVIDTETNYIHEVQRNLLLIKDFTDEKPATTKLYPTKEDYDEVNQLLKEEPLNGESFNVNENQSATKYICVAPASVWFNKQYPKEKWIAFLKLLPSSFKIYLLGAGSDRNLCDEILNAIPGDAVRNLCGKLSFLQSAALMQNASMNYANDSAPLHIASAMNAPVTAVFCSTVLWFGYGPTSNKSNVVQIDYPLYCRPCSLHGKKYCPEKHFKCALDIKEEQLLKTLDNTAKGLGFYEH